MNQTKICTKCGENKPATFEYFHRKGSRLFSVCKKCRKEQAAKYNAKPETKEKRRLYYARPEIKEKAKEHRAKYRSKPEYKEKHKSYTVGWRNKPENKEKKRMRDARPENVERRKKYASILENKEKHKSYKVKYNARPENKEKRRLLDAKPENVERRKKYASKPENRKKINDNRRNRKKTDASYWMECTLRRRFLLALNGKDKADSILKLIGCSIEELWIYLENQFKPGMTRGNRGEWHIDHIIPCAAFDLSDPEQQKKCFHYTNLQPLWAEENLRKNSKIL